VSHGLNRQSERFAETQLGTIRALMFDAAQRDTWLTLAEIAELTEIGEASVSAQLRHLRKPHHGPHLVEKRRRPTESTDRFASSRAAESSGAERRIAPGRARWEYRVLPLATAVCRSARRRRAER